MAAAVDARLIPESPCRNISLPRSADHEQRFLTPEEVQHLADGIEPTFRALVLSDAYPLGRTRGIQANATEPAARVYRGCRHTGGGGGVAPRYVEATRTTFSRRKLFVPAFLIDELEKHLSEAPPRDFVFSSVEGHPLRRNNFRKVLLASGSRSSGAGSASLSRPQTHLRESAYRAGCPRQGDSDPSRPRLPYDNDECLRAHPAEPGRATYDRPG
jgi:hypothetical protein